MNKSVFITGGSRSGKSTYAESIFNNINEKKIYLATGVACDDEMKNRIDKHRADRGNEFITLEASKNLKEELEKSYESFNFILLDCVGFLLNNIMFEDINFDIENLNFEMAKLIEEKILKEFEMLFEYFKAKKNGILVIVSNEIGMGLVPEHSLSRYYRDILGRTNQFIAKRADEVYFMVSGIELKIK